MFNLELSGASAFEIVTVDELKAHARIYTTADDTYLSSLVVAAREQVENDLNIVLCSQDYVMHLDQWLNHAWYDRYYHYGYGFPYYFNTFSYWYQKIIIPIQPVQAVSGITYTDTDGTVQTYDPANYQVRTYTDPIEIVLTGNLPDIQTFSTIDVAFTAGYDTADDIPAIFHHAVKFLASHWYEHREAASETLVREVPQAYKRIIDRHKVKRLR